MAFLHHSPSNAQIFTTPFPTPRTPRLLSCVSQRQRYPLSACTAEHQNISISSRNNIRSGKQTRDARGKTAHAFHFLTPAATPNAALLDRGSRKGWVGLRDLPLTARTTFLIKNRKLAAAR